MANRFLETNYYKSPFVRGLKGSLKGLYSFIICDCTPSGIWALDIEAASLYIGFQITFEEFDDFFIKKGKAVDLGNGKYFFPDFIEHQYPKGLSGKNIAHNNIIPELKKLKLIDDKNTVIKRLVNPPLIHHERPKGIGNGNVIGNYTNTLTSSLVTDMVKIYQIKNPNYPINPEIHYPQILQIAHRIAKLKQWEKNEVMNGKLKPTLESWTTIVDFVMADDWLSTRGLIDINSDKEWDRLILKMERAKKPKPTENTGSYITKEKDVDFDKYKKG